MAPLMRWTTAWIVAQSWIITSLTWAGRGEMPHARGVFAWASLDWMTSWPAWAAMTGGLAWALWSWVRANAPVRSAWAMVALLGVAAHMELSVTQGVMPSLSLVLPGNLLGAWAVGWWWARGQPLHERRLVSHEVCCGVMAAMLFLTGVAKLVTTGPAWMAGEGVALTIYERSYGALPWLAEIRRWASSSPWFPPAAASITVLVELGGALFVLPAARAWIGLGMVGVVLGFAVFMGMTHLEWAVLPLALAYGAPVAKEPAG